jgi:hypothetical protein
VDVEDPPARAARCITAGRRGEKVEEEGVPAAEGRKRDATGSYAARADEVRRRRRSSSSSCTNAAWDLTPDEGFPRVLLKRQDFGSRWQLEIV